MFNWCNTTLTCNPKPKAVHAMLTRKHHKNLQALFVFNSTIWLKTALVFVVTDPEPNLKPKPNPQP